jgi:hypothetical protein
MQRYSFKLNSNSCLSEVVFINAGHGFKGTETPVDSDRVACSKWKKVCSDLFDPPEIRTYELAVMINAQPNCLFNPQIRAVIEEKQKQACG